MPFLWNTLVFWYDIFITTVTSYGLTWSTTSIYGLTWSTTSISVSVQHLIGRGLFLFWAGINVRSSYPQGGQPWLGFKPRLLRWQTRRFITYWPIPLSIKKIPFYGRIAGQCFWCIAIIPLSMVCNHLLHKSETTYPGSTHTSRRFSKKTVISFPWFPHVSNTLSLLQSATKCVPQSTTEHRVPQRAF